MQIAYVVLYVSDAELCRRFWIERVGMVEKARVEHGAFSVVQVGFADQDCAFELVPLAMMADNPDGLDLAAPSIAFRVDDLETTRERLLENGVEALEIGEHSGVTSFAFSDPEGRWFAVVG